tara:strand:- start:153 stop:503 length:351 start_codon:yes stop_codon:yes gene_type:complete
MADKADLAPGQTVYFGRPNGEKTKGRVVKVNRTKAKVEQLEQRGVYKAHPVGTVWTVPFKLIWTEDKPATLTRITRKLVWPPRSLQDAAETAFERRAAFGPGQTVVDVMTGQQYRT